MGADPKCTILVTGFGPFQDHEVNASWEAVKELQKLWTDSKEVSNVKLIIEEIPVLYSVVSTHVPQLWKKHNPTVNIIIYIRIMQFNNMIFVKTISLVLDCSTCGCVTQS